MKKQSPTDAANDAEKNSARNPHYFDLVEFDKEFQQLGLGKSGSYRSVHDKYSHFLWSDPLFGADFLRAYFPNWEQYYDFSQIEITPTVFTDAAQNRRAADMIYKIPSRDKDLNPLSLSLLFEFKAQSGVSEDRRTLLSVLQYAAFNMQNELERNSAEKVTQTIPLLVYNGPDENFSLGSLNELFPLGPGCEEYRANYPVKTLNLTQEFQRDRLVGSEYVQLACGVLGCAGLRSLVASRLRLFSLLHAVYKRPEDEENRKGAALEAALMYIGSAANNVRQSFTKDEYYELVYGNETGGEEMESFIKIWTGKTIEEHEQEWREVARKELEEKIQMAREEGERIAREEAERKARESMFGLYADLVKDGKLTKTEAAERLGITVAQFRAEMARLSENR